MDRRRFLETIGTASTVTLVGLAGCGSPGGGGQTPGEGSPGVPDEDVTSPGEGTESPQDGTPTGDETPEEDGTPAEDGTATEEGTGTPTGDTGTVAMRTDGEEYVFDPIGLYVEPGTEVTWVNESGAHSSTAYAEGNPAAETTRIPDDAEGWDSGTLSEEGAEFSHTFETEGTYDYYCIPHKGQGMVGRVVVGSPGGPGDEGQPPDGDVPESSAIVEQGSVAYDDFTGG